MTTFYLIRHGEATYKPIDERKFIGQGRDLAPLTQKGIKQIKETAKDMRLMESNIIISSPYTRALQSSAILSKELGINIEVELDLHEWIPDIINFQHKTSEDCFSLNRDFDLHNGIYPKGEMKVWETHENMKKRMDIVLEKYLNYNKVIVVCHEMVINTIKSQKNIFNGEIIEYYR
ncbi:histidine phosphatase family protein [Clostridium sp.]|uniref:histidine phosphatase family protein n=1 Tax=Clostridium sp. TaxID=1506 RepID=UPI003D6D58C4